jgi:hypothetical protein
MDDMAKAIITSVCAVITAILSPIINWALRSLPRPEKRDKFNRTGLWIVISLLIIFIMLTTVLYISATTKYRGILPDFGFATCSPFQSNSSMYFEKKKDYSLSQLTTLIWISPQTIEQQYIASYNVNSLKNTPVTNKTTPLLIVPLKECVFFESHLQSEPSWTGLMFSKPLSIFSVDLSNKSQMLLVLKADVRAIIELGLKDINQNESKINFAVEQGWHGYIIPLERFRRVNKNRIQMLLIAHSSKSKMAENNQFCIARLEFR